MASELLVNKITPESGTTLTLGDSGDTISFASGVLPSLESLTITGDLTVDTDTFYVDSTNNRVGVGTASPSTLLDVSATQSVMALRSTGAFNSTLNFYSSSSTLEAGVVSVAGGASLLFTTGSSGTERMRIDSSGNVGIGDSSPDTKLDIAATVPYITLQDTSGVGTGSDYGGIQWQASNDNINGKITVEQQSGTSGGAMKFWTQQFASPPITERMRITHKGAVLIGTSSEGSAGGGDLVVADTIYLGGTGSANALDDYETGTWTPGFTFGGSSAGIVYTVQDGQYTKIGRQVTCSFDLRLSNNGTGVGNAKLTGLPFTVGNLLPNTALEGGGLVTYHTSQGTAHTSLSIVPDDGSTEAFMYVDLVTSATNAYIGNSCNMRGVFTYFTS